MSSLPYKFTYNLSRIPKYFFTEITKASYQKGVHKKLGKTAKDIIKKCKLQEATGLNFTDAVVLLQDLLEMQVRNLIEREKFIKTKRRVLFLPHCSRKFMDHRCKAIFDSDMPSYICEHCSPDCLVNKASSMAEKKGYDVYVLPGGSCVPKILEARNYEGVVGVACGEELKMSGNVLESADVAGQAIPLTKNGCSNTSFNMETLSTIL